MRERGEPDLCSGGVLSLSLSYRERGEQQDTPLKRKHLVLRTLAKPFDSRKIANKIYITGASLQTRPPN